MKPKYKPGDLVCRYEDVLFILSCEKETGTLRAHYRYYNLRYPDHYSKIEKEYLEKYYTKVNK